MVRKRDIFNELSGRFPAGFVATKLDICNETSGHFPTVCGKTVFFTETSGHFPAVFAATSIFTGTSRYFAVNFLATKQNIFTEWETTSTDRTKDRHNVLPSASAFVVTKLDIFHETSGHFPAVFVVTKLNICNGTLEHLRGVFMETKPYILKYEICFNQVV